MDSDDIILPDALQTCYDLAQKRRADVCIFDDILDSGLWIG
jgi:hypothetical protein